MVMIPCDLMHHDEVYLAGENEIKIEFNIKREKSPPTDLFMIHKI